MKASSPGGFFILPREVTHDATNNPEAGRRISKCRQCNYLPDPGVQIIILIPHPRLPAKAPGAAAGGKSFY
jgi:hypothetical protein